jgi:hypothetical protein
MAFDFGGSGSDPSVMGWGNTQATDYSINPLSDGVPANVVDVSRSDGITWDGVLSKVSATADSLFSTFGKVYQLNSNVENEKFQRMVNEANRELKRAETMGTLDIKRAQIDANLAIEKARAGRATSDAITQMNSGVAGFVTVPGKIPTGMVLLGVAALGAAIYFSRGK